MGQLRLSSHPAGSVVGDGFDKLSSVSLHVPARPGCTGRCPVRTRATYVFQTASTLYYLRFATPCQPAWIGEAGNRKELIVKHHLARACIHDGQEAGLACLGCLATSDSFPAVLYCVVMNRSARALVARLLVWSLHQPHLSCTMISSRSLAHKGLHLRVWRL